MNPRYRETFRQRRRLFLLPVVLGALFALWASVGSPKLYQSGASLWSDTAGGQAQAFGATPPAAQDQAMLMELLKTNYFIHNVARHSPLQGYLERHPSQGFGPFTLLKSLSGAPSLDDRIAAALGPKRVIATPQGQHVLEISFDAPDPKLAQTTLSVLIEEFKKQRAVLQQDGLTSAQLQVTAATKALAAARAGVNTYLRGHPGNSRSDPELRVLTNAEHTAVTQLNQATATLNQASSAVLNGAGINTSLRTLDPPRLPVGPSKGKKKLLESILAGAFAGMLLSVLAIVVMTKVGTPPSTPAGGEREEAANGTSTNGFHPAPAVNGEAPAETRREHAPSAESWLE